MGSTKIESWNGNALKLKVQQTTKRNVQYACLFFQQKLVETISVANPGGKEPSAPGEPPRRVTGTLADNVAIEIQDEPLVGRVGIRKNAIYGIYLETGTTKGLAARPWIRVTWEKFRRQVMLFATGGRE